MSDSISQWLNANYPNLALPEATRAKLLSLVGPQYSYMALPELWNLYLTNLGYSGSLAEKFNALYSALNASAQNRNPFSVVTEL